MVIIEIEWDFGNSYVDKVIIWVFRSIVFYSFNFVRIFLKSYSKLNKSLVRNAANFKLLRFTLIYFAVVFCIASTISLLFSRNSDSVLYTGLIFLVFFFLYLIFFTVFLVYYFLQRIYLTFMSLILTIESIRKTKD